MKFTVVIPTRDRVDTLEWSLKTCLCQNYDELEIIVSDNASQDRTADFMKSISDPRVRYCNTGKRLGMSQNWEFALSHVKDGFVFFMGDDDGLLPDAIQMANQLLTENMADALAWKKASYAWPNHIDPRSRNSLMLPFHRGIENIDSKQMLQRICNFEPGYSYENLPGLYNSFVAISAINKARSRDGRFFCSQIPDVYSAIALTSSLRNYIYSFRPLSINGASGHSNGTSYMKDPKLEAAAKFLAEDNIPFHVDLLLAPSIPLIVAESVWQVRDNVQNCKNYDVNIEKLFVAARMEAMTLPGASRELVEASLDRVSEVRGRGILQAEINNSSDSIFGKLQMRIKNYQNFIFSYQTKFDVENVANVYQVSILCPELAKRRTWLVIYNTLRFIRLKVANIAKRMKNHIKNRLPS